MIDESDCGAIGGIKIGRGNRSTRRKPAPPPLCPPQTPHDQTRAPTPGRRSGKPATNRLSYGAAFWFGLLFDPGDGKMFPPKRRAVSELHGVTIHKTVLFNNSVVMHPILSLRIHVHEAATEQPH
jgi:hypothetical protein